MAERPAQGEPQREGEPQAAPLHGFEALSAFEEHAPRELLWDPYIARGLFGIVEGDPGFGKSTLLQKLAADLSCGRRPGPPPESGLQVVGRPQPSLYVTTEQSIEEDIMPLLRALEANESYIHVRSVQRHGRLTLDAGGLALLRDAMTDLHPALCVFDPLASFAPGNLSDPRHLADELVTLAEEMDCTIIAVRHWTKARGRSAAAAGFGGMALFAAARFVLTVSPDPAHPGQSVVAQAKSSKGPLHPSQGFAVRIGETPPFRWTGRQPVSAEELRVGAGEGALADARRFWHMALADGPRITREVMEEGEGDWRISARTLSRARGTLAIENRKIGLPGRAVRSVTFCKLAGTPWPPDQELRRLAEEYLGQQGEESEHRP